ncbi:MAG: hypothetical protein IJD95_06525 [Clostridia bacterium]|nr:hypothetical protein [Clostridia bacterium]MBR2327344.1 hypothetical protein [Clostridia bacterium]
MKRIVSFVALLTFLLLCGCSLQTGGMPSDFTAILHAGGSKDGLTYLNATEPFYEYYAAGYRYFEYDLMLSSDGRIIGAHEDVYFSAAELRALGYEQFKELRLPGGYTPVNEEWLIETVMSYPDVKIVVDAKMPTLSEDAAVLCRIEELGRLYGIDLSANIIPEVFGAEMWDILKESTSFDGYFYSQYKVYYTVDMILDHFGDDGRIIGICFPDYVDGDIRAGFSRLKEAGKKIFIFTCENEDEADYIKRIGADGAYVDDPSVLE